MRRIDPPHRNMPKLKAMPQLPQGQIIAQKSPVHSAIMALKDLELRDQMWDHLDRFEAMQIESQEDITKLFGGLMQLILYGIVDVKCGDLMRKIICNTSESRQTFMEKEFPAELMRRVEATIERYVGAFETLLVTEVGQERAAKVIAKARSIVSEADSGQ